MDSTTRHLQLRKAAPTTSDPVHIRAATDACADGFFQCPESLGGFCCPTGFLCEGDRSCMRNVAISGTTTVTSVITVSATQAITTDYATQDHLAPADIGGIVGGVVGALLLLGTIAWVIMRRLNGIMRYVQTRISPFTDNAPGGESGSLEKNLNQADHQQLPSEVWDSQSGGTFQRPIGELIGSYDAHGTSELDGNVLPTEDRSAT
ncbi:hypothetical protein GGR51DRAFT_515571 [Nemania sp. FL0031]|nr:hypothetical protein GGR51DRAFT_515571 [Nemania sp. FL0031]